MYDIALMAAGAFITSQGIIKRTCGSCFCKNVAATELSRDEACGTWRSY